DLRRLHRRKPSASRAPARRPLQHPDPQAAETRMVPAGPDRPPRPPPAAQAQAAHRAAPPPHPGPPRPRAARPARRDGQDRPHLRLRRSADARLLLFLLLSPPSPHSALRVGRGAVCLETAVRGYTLLPPPSPPAPPPPPISTTLSPFSSGNGERCR